MNGLIKIHKENYPIRPLINFTPAPAYNVSKTITNFLKEKINLPNTYTIKNNKELTDNIQNTEITPNTRIYSFDITNMYTNIPIKETINIITNTLNDKQIDVKTINEIKTALELILSQNYFQHNNEYYTQNDGLAMGSPSSSLLSEIFLQIKIEPKLIEILKKHDPNSIYHRYVDDCIFITKNNANIDNILNEINQIHNNIKFTLEKESNQKINFLDLTIERTESNLHFDIYRKPTLTSAVIPNHSFHPPQHKMAAFRALINRMNNIPMSNENKQKEFKIIKQIATENGYQTKTINKLKNKIDQQKHKQPYQNKNKHETIWRKFNYNNIDNNKINKLLKENNITTAYKSNNKTLNNIKPTINKLDITKNGIYQLKCGSCPKSYIGQTKFPLKIRYQQHKYAYNDPTTYHSNLATHCQNNNHRFPNLDEIKHIKTTKKYRMNVWENLHIYKNHKQNKLIQEQIQISNTQTNFFNMIKYINHNNVPPYINQNTIPPCTNNTPPTSSTNPDSTANPNNPLTLTPGTNVPKHRYCLRKRQN